MDGSQGALFNVKGSRALRRRCGKIYKCPEQLHAEYVVTRNHGNRVRQVEYTTSVYANCGERWWSAIRESVAGYRYGTRHGRGVVLSGVLVRDSLDQASCGADRRLLRWETSKGVAWYTDETFHHSTFDVIEDGQVGRGEFGQAECGVEREPCYSACKSAALA